MALPLAEAQSEQGKVSSWDHYPLDKLITKVFKEPAQLARVDGLESCGCTLLVVACHCCLARDVRHPPAVFQWVQTTCRVTGKNPCHGWACVLLECSTLVLKLSLKARELERVKGPGPTVPLMPAESALCLYRALSSSV